MLWNDLKGLEKGFILLVRKRVVVLMDPGHWPISHCGALERVGVTHSHPCSFILGECILTQNESNPLATSC